MPRQWRDVVAEVALELTFAHTAHGDRTDLETSRPSYTTRSLVTRVGVTHHDLVLFGCCETRSVSARLVLKTCIPVQLFAVEFANRSQFFS